LETFRQIEVKLHGRQLPVAADRVLDPDVDLRTVEHRLAFYARVRNVPRVQRIDEGGFRIVPVFVGTEIVHVWIVAADRELDLDVFEAENFVDVESKIDTSEDLAAYLLGRAEDMRIVLRKPAHARQSVQRAGEFSAVTRAELGGAQRQIAIRALSRLVNADMKRTVHRFDPEFLF